MASSVCTVTSVAIRTARPVARIRRSRYEWSITGVNSLLEIIKGTGVPVRTFDLVLGVALVCSTIHSK